MSNHDMRAHARQYLCPCILDGKHARALAAKIFFKYGIVSLLLSKKASPLDFVSFFYKRIPCVAQGTSNARLLCEELTDMAHSCNGLMMMLVPTSDSDRSAIDAYGDELEAFFIICSEDAVFCDSPLAQIP